MVAAPRTSQAREEFELRAVALDYAQRGWRVFPLAPNTKVPLIPKKRGGNGCLDATTNHSTITEWWTRYRSANIGWAMGKGYVAIDEDTYKGADLTAWRLPPTLQSRSARGGLHHIYRYDGAPLDCVPEGLLAPGVCVRGVGGYIVAPPSRVQTADGFRFYEFVDPHQPMVELPERIAALIRASGQDSQEQKKQEAQSSPKARRRASAAEASADQQSGQYWLDWAMGKTGMGRGDLVGVLLAQQLLVNHAFDVDDTLLAYARQATVNPRDPFTVRDAARWKRSAEQSRIVQRGEPARSQRTQRAAPTVAAERPHHEKTVRKAPEVVTDEAERVTEQPVEPEPEQPDDAALLKFSADDNGNAEAMRLLYGRELLYSPVYGWMQWSSTHWQTVPDALVMRFVIAALKRRRHAAVDAQNEAIIKATACSLTRVRGCMALFMAYVVEPDVRVFDADPDTLNCANGVVHLRSGRITPHQSRQRFTYCVPVPYDRQADMSTWLAFVQEAIGGDADVASYLQMCAGYSLTGHTKDEKVFYLYGPTRAGKGTFTETMLALLPTPLSAEVDFTTFTAQRDADAQNFDLAGLKPSRLVFASESNRRQKLNPARMKQFSGGNMVRCAFKHRDMFEYHPQFSVWLVSNNPANADADDDALWGRLHVIEFPRSHLGQEDTTLKTRLRTPETLRGVLRWLIEGAARWYRDGQLKAPERVVATTTAQRDEQDYVRQWLDACCTLGGVVWMPSTRLYASYQQWCKTNTLTALRPNEFGETLVKRFKVTAKRQAGTGARGYTGISLASDGQASLWSEV